MKNKYIFNHNFGYGRENELDELFKLNLRDFQDLKDYIDFVIDDLFVATTKNSVIKFLDDNTKIKIILEKV